MDRDDAPRPDPRPSPRGVRSLAPEHDWAAAADLIHPALRPAGTTGVDGRNLQAGSGGGLPGKPLIVPGPADLALAYVLPGPGFGVLVGAEHLLAWGVGPERVHEAAMANLASWSAGATWVEELDGPRHIVWSDTGEGTDSARILLPEVRAQLAADLGPAGRILVGLPERDLLIATGVTPGDDEFVDLFGRYVADRWASADEPVAERLFELVDGVLLPSGGAAGARS
jgi:hypothetical protein